VSLGAHNSMPLKNKIRSIFAISLLLVSGSLASGMHPLSVLRSSFVAHADSVLLSDLLPAQVPESLRSAAEKIVVADSPPPGAHRTLDRPEIERALRDAPDLRQSLEIPPAIDITRWSRPLSKAEVFAAVRDAFVSNQIPGAESLSPGSLALSAAISVTEDAPKLRVTRIESSRDGSVTRVRLWTSSEPRTPPFWVTLAPASDRPAARAGTDSLTNAPSSCPEIRSQSVAAPGALREIKIPNQPSRPFSLDSSVLVKVGVPIQLILQGRGMRIATPAVPLDPGRQNQKIRVRASTSGKVLVGTVTSSQTVEVQY
jgi:Chaperone for flagella basal body P-ring formation